MNTWDKRKVVPNKRAELHVAEPVKNPDGEIVDILLEKIAAWKIHDDDTVYPIIIDGIWVQDLPIYNIETEEWYFLDGTRGAGKKRLIDFFDKKRKNEKQKPRIKNRS